MKIDLTTDYVRPYLFLVVPNKEELKEYKTLLSSFIRSIECNGKITKIKFMLDEKNIIWNFFETCKDFDVEWLDRKGNTVNGIEYSDYQVINMYVEKFEHQSDNKYNAAIGVVLINN